MMVGFFYLNLFILKNSLDENKEDPNLAFGGSSVSFKQGRQLLRQYVMKEILFEEKSFSF
jgi:hypothetical protein